MEREHGKRDIEREVRKATKKQQGFRAFFKARLQKKVLGRVGGRQKSLDFFFTPSGNFAVVSAFHAYLRWEEGRMDKGLQGGRWKGGFLAWKGGSR